MCGRAGSAVRIRRGCKLDMKLTPATAPATPAHKRSHSPRRRWTQQQGLHDNFAYGHDCSRSGAIDHARRCGCEPSQQEETFASGSWTTIIASPYFGPIRLCRLERRRGRRHQSADGSNQPGQVGSGRVHGKKFRAFHQRDHRRRSPPRRNLPSRHHGNHLGRARHAAPVWARMGPAIRAVPRLP